MTRRFRFLFLLGFGAVVLAPCLTVACSNSLDYTSPPPSFRTPPSPTASCTTRFLCGTLCTDPQRDRENCGRCGTTCGAGETCQGAICTRASGFAIRKIFFGETDRAGKVDKDAWKSYGRNIDLLTSAGAATDETWCKRVVGAPLTNYEDGIAGIDNSFGRNILPLLVPLAKDLSATTTSALEAGARTNVIQLGTWDGSNNHAGFSNQWLVGEKLGSARWNGFDIRDHIPYTSSSSYTFTGDIADGVYTMDASSFATLLIRFAIGAGEISNGGGGVTILELRKPTISMKLSGDLQSASEGIISGLVGVTEMEAAMTSLYRSINGNCNTPDPALDALIQAIHQAADMPISAARDPERDCDAISVGIGFEAGLVVIGKSRGSEELPANPCEP